MATNAGKFGFLLMLWLIAAPARAQDTVLTYPESFFAGIQLSTAYDMVSRLPGFVYSQGQNARGYSGTSGNVLIDSARPTAKTDDLTTILQRIPAARVARIDVIRGGAPGIDMQGLPVIANVILKREDSTDAILTLQELAYGDRHTVPYGNVEFTRKSGNHVYDLTVSRFGSYSDDSIGTGTFTIRTPGAPDISAVEKKRGADRLGWGVNGALQLPLANGNLAANFTYRGTTTNSTIAYGAPVSAVYFTSEKVRPIETGLNWKGRWGAAELEMLGLERIDHQQSLNISDDSAGHQLFTATRDTGESIARGTARYHAGEALTLESGLETAFNSLDGTSGYALNGVAIAVPAANVKVQELRGEAFAQASWKIAPDWSLEAGLRGEASGIAARGVAARTFVFLKPRLVLSWTPWDGHQFRLRAEKIVGQLDFNNFIASSDLSGSGVSAGNLGLRPDRRVQLEGNYEFHFWDRGALSFTYLHEDITDLVDYIPIGKGLDGPGNIAKAVNDQFNLELSVPLSRLGLEGGLLRGSMTWRDSALTDPVDGRTRPISNARDRNLNFYYDQDLPSLNSSLELLYSPGGGLQPRYRIGQISTIRIHSDFMWLVWDYKPRPDLDLYFKWTDFGPYRFELERQVFAGVRGSAPLSRVENQSIVTVPRLLIQLRKTF